VCSATSGSGQAQVFSNVFFHPSPYGLWYQPWWILRTGQELITEQHHDVMTVHEYPPFYNGLGARWLHHAMGVPYALEIHHIVGYPKATSTMEWIGRLLSRWYLRWDACHANKIRTVNEQVRAILTLWGIPQEKIEVVSSLYLDHAALKIDPAIEKRYDVVFSGRLVSNKGVDSLLQAVQRVPRVTLCIIGDGPKRCSLQRRARFLGITNRVTFTGWLPTQNEVYRALQSAKVFVMNSRSEGNPRVLIEAMALGLPVITTRVGIAPDVVEHRVNGLFTEGIPSDLAERIGELLSDEPLRSRLGLAAKSIRSEYERSSRIATYATFLKSITSSAS